MQTVVRHHCCRYVRSQGKFLVTVGSTDMDCCRTLQGHTGKVSAMVFVTAIDFGLEKGHGFLSFTRSGRDSQWLQASLKWKKITGEGKAKVQHNSTKSINIVALQSIQHIEDEGSIVDLEKMATAPNLPLLESRDCMDNYKKYPSSQSQIPFQIKPLFTIFSRIVVRFMSPGSGFSSSSLVVGFLGKKWYVRSQGKFLVTVGSTDIDCCRTLQGHTGKVSAMVFVTAIDFGLEKGHGFLSFTRSGRVSQWLQAALKWKKITGEGKAKVQHNSTKSINIFALQSIQHIEDEGSIVDLEKMATAPNLPLLESQDCMDNYKKYPSSQSQIPFQIKDNNSGVKG
ncbi:hypothetical protein V6N13_001434 [Hibiscus sabdariffa]|uniref:Uncharacterized protein n=1 Tax=Hibiscus sabdariffa TaxID=183260 RepID=A0ABR2G997_9ROSI